MAENIWLGRVIIIVILAVIGFFLGMFVSTLHKKAGETVVQEKERKSKYEKIGAASGLVLGAVWALVVAQKDKKVQRAVTFSNNRGGSRLVPEPF